MFRWQITNFNDQNAGDSIQFAVYVIASNEAIPLKIDYSIQVADFRVEFSNIEIEKKNIQFTSSVTKLNTAI